MTSTTARRPWPFTTWEVAGVGAAMIAGAAGTLFGPLPLVVAAGGAALLVAMVRAPGLVLGAYLLIPYYKGAVQPYSPIDLTVVLAVANAAQIVPVLFRRRRPAGFGGRLALWLALGAVVLGGVLYAPDPSLAMNKAVTYWVLVVMPLVPAALRVVSEPGQLALVATAFCAMGAVVSVLGLDLLSPNSRLTVLGMNTIQVARAAMFLPITGILFAIPLQLRWLTILTIALIPISLVVALASGSRGPLLVIAVLGTCGAARYFARMRVGRWRALAAGAGVAVLGVLVVALFSSSLPAASLARFGDLLAFIQGTGGGTETSAAVRVVLFGFAVQLWSSSPLIGVGTGGFLVLSTLALGPAGDAYPHNAILQVLAENGLVGLVVFGAVMMVGLLRKLPNDSVAATVHALYAFFLLNAMVSGDIFTDRETLGLLLLLLVLPRTVDAARDAAHGIRQGAAKSGEVSTDPIRQAQGVRA